MLITILIFLLLSNALTSRKDKSLLYARVVIATLLITSILSLDNLYLKPLSEGVGIYGGLFNVNSYTHTFNIFIYILSAIILNFNSFYPRTLKFENNTGKNAYNLSSKPNLDYSSYLFNTGGESFRIIEYPLIIVFIICGGVFLISSADLISVFLSIELQSYGLYILSTLYRDSESATSSGLTYFLLGGLSSCFILLGSALLYANSGTTSLENIYVISSISEINDISLYWYQPYYLHISLIILTVGFLFKVSAAPFHIWSPNVYDGIPTVVTTYVAIIAKISIFAFLAELVYYTDHSLFSFTWKSILLISSIASLIIGSVLGLTQFRIKRLFAYSTISHVGFVLLALAINSVESIQSYIFYILQYSLSNLNAFTLLIVIGYSLYFYVDKSYISGYDQKGQSKDKANSPIHLIKQIKGYYFVNPYIAISLAITLFSFVGVPPMIGFFAKQMVLSAALDSGYVFISLVAIITSVIGAGYYLNLIKTIFFFKDNYEINPLLNKLGSANINQISGDSNIKDSNVEGKLKNPLNLNHLFISGAFSFIISILTLLLITFIFTPELWFNIVSILTIIIFKN